jgi:hypothetical protein
LLCAWCCCSRSQLRFCSLQFRFLVCASICPVCVHANWFFRRRRFSYSIFHFHRWFLPSAWIGRCRPLVFAVSSIWILTSSFRSPPPIRAQETAPWFEFSAAKIFIRPRFCSCAGLSTGRKSIFPLASSLVQERRARQARSGARHLSVSSRAVASWFPADLGARGSVLSDLRGKVSVFDFLFPRPA